MKEKLVITLLKADKLPEFLKDDDHPGNVLKAETEYGEERNRLTKTHYYRIGDCFEKEEVAKKLMDKAKKLSQRSSLAISSYGIPEEVTLLESLAEEVLKGNLKTPKA